MKKTSQEVQVRELVDNMMNLRDSTLEPGEQFEGFMAKQKNKSRLICGDCDCGMAGCDP